MTDADDPRAQAQQMITAARQAFAADVDLLLRDLRDWASQVHDTSFDEVSRAELLIALRSFVLTKFDQCLPPRPSLEAVTLRQLLREALEIIDACYTGQDCALNLRDWLKAARVVLGEPDSEGT